MELNFDGFCGFGGGESTSEPIAANEPAEKSGTKKSHRRKTACAELSAKYEYRRAFSEVKMLEAMNYVKLKKGVSYNFITAGDVDGLTYLKVVLNAHDLDYVLCSTWVISAEDMLQLRTWYEEGRIRHLDLYLGEIFPNQYKVEWAMVKQFYADHPEAGRTAVFRNHAKIWAGYNEDDDFYFASQASSNCNTNPRIEQGCITIDRGLYEFYKEYFDGIKSFIKDEQKAPKAKGD